MKLKYYLRGLGAGILFSVLLFAFVVSPEEATISDDEIIQRAKQLGMVEKKELSIDMEKLRDSPPMPSPTNEPSPTPTNIPTPTLTPTLAPTPTLKPTLTPTPTLMLTMSPTPAATPTEVPMKDNSDVSEIVSAFIEIKSGMRSEDICVAIEKAGVIENATQLNAYLIQNGYAERLRSGRFELNSSMTFEEIAKILIW